MRGAFPLRFLQLAVWATAAGAIWPSANPTARAQESTIESKEPWSNVFAGQEIKLPIRFVKPVGDQQAVNWSVAVENRVLLRREERVPADAGNGGQLTLAFRLPDEEPKVVVSATVNVETAGRQFAKPLFIFPRDPFADNAPFPAETKLLIFDPLKETSSRLAGIKSDIKPVRNLDILLNERPEVLIVGEGTNFRSYRNLGQLLVQLAANGSRVLCLAPVGASLELAPPGARFAPNAIRLRTEDVVASFDKRLDFLAWPGEGSVVRSRFVLHGKGASLTAEATADAVGWPWLEAEFPGGGRLILCGFGLISRWDDSPAPRYILRHALAHAARPRSPTAPMDNPP